MNNVEKIKQEAQNLRDKLNDRVNENEFIAGEVFILNYFLSYIDLHNEPVCDDLEEEIKEVQRDYKTIEEYEGYPCTMYANGIEWIARHFFELGLKAQKGE
jgi:hypothetical protein